MSILSKSCVQTFGLSACCVRSGTKLYSQNCIYKSVIYQLSFAKKIGNLNFYIIIYIFSKKCIMICAYK